jgi:putative transposase
MVEKGHPQPSVTRQCRPLGLKRSTYYYQARGESPYNQELMRRIDEQFLETPFYGTRQMKRHLVNMGYAVGRRKVKRLMRKMGLTAVYQKPRISNPHPENKTYPYLLHGLKVDRLNQVWYADITFIPMQRGFLYLVAVMDWYSVPCFHGGFPSTMASDFCVAALEDAINRYGVQGIFNTDQGSQFTSYDFTRTLKEAGTRISMDGTGRWMDNIFIERLWRSLKWECVYLRELESESRTRAELGKWFHFYNWKRPHSFFDGKRPIEVYYNESND